MGLFTPPRRWKDFPENLRASAYLFAQERVDLPDRLDNEHSLVDSTPNKYNAGRGNPNHGKVMSKSQSTDNLRSGSRTPSSSRTASGRTPSNPRVESLAARPSMSSSPASSPVEFERSSRVMLPRPTSPTPAKRSFTAPLTTMCGARAVKSGSLGLGRPSSKPTMVHGSSTDVPSNLGRRPSYDQDASGPATPRRPRELEPFPLSTPPRRDLSGGMPPPSVPRGASGPGLFSSSSSARVRKVSGSDPFTDGPEQGSPRRPSISRIQTPQPRRTSGPPTTTPGASGSGSSSVGPARVRKISNLARSSVHPYASGSSEPF